MLRHLACLAVLSPAWAWAQVAPVLAPAPPAGTTILVADRALDGRGGVMQAVRIAVSSGRIVDLHAPAGDAGAVIDLRGYTVLPGWIDTHVHLESHFAKDGRIATRREPANEAALGVANNAWMTLMAGFTTVQSVGDPSEAALRDLIRDHGYPGPRVLTSLAPISPDSTVAPDSLRALVRKRHADGADLIKIFASRSQRVGAGPTISEAQLRALCDEARVVGLRSMVHAYRGQVGAAARAGCGQIEHATYTTQADIDDAVKAGAYLSPQVGLVVQNYIENKARYLGVGNYTEEGMAIMDRDLHFDFEVCSLMAKTPGAKIVFSTDATAGAHGRNAEEFIGRVERCGLSPMAVLTSAASVAAASMGLGDRIGSLAVGHDADIIALDGDPLTDITAVRRVAFVMRGGVIYRWAGPKPQTRR